MKTISPTMTIHQTHRIRILDFLRLVEKNVRKVMSRVDVSIATKVLIGCDYSIPGATKGV